MATQLTNYQCPACTGPLHFDGASGKLVCDFCGSSYDTAEIEALYAEKEAAAETAAQNKQAPPPDSVWSENEAAGLRSYFGKIWPLLKSQGVVHTVKRDKKRLHVLESAK